jgi:Nucleotide modification associated domain 5
MRLNGEMRTEIKRFALAKLDKERQLFAEVEQKLLIDCYNAVVPLATQKMIAALEKARVGGNPWVAYNSATSFNVAGQRVYLGQINIPVDKRITVALPSGLWSGPLGTITMDKHAKLVERVRDWQGKVEKEKADYETAVKTLDLLLKSVSTVEKLKQYWPEGRDFFSSPPCQTRAASGLPAVQIEALNKMLGIKTEELTI